MSFAETHPSLWANSAAHAAADERVDFIRKTYLHLAGAIAAFAALEAVLLNLPGTEALIQKMSGGQYSWLIVLGAFMFVSWIAERWANSATSRSTQYMGLGLYVVAEAVIFLPLLYVADRFFPDQNVIATAATITLVLFGGLTITVFTTGKDFSFLRTGLMMAGFAAFGLIVCGMIFGFQLGMLFMVAMVALACGYILYHTSNILHHYRVDQYVAASLALFASVALLFWYILQIVMRYSSDD